MKLRQGVDKSKPDARPLANKIDRAASWDSRSRHTSLGCSGDLLTEQIMRRYGAWSQGDMWGYLVDFQQLAGSGACLVDPKACFVSGLMLQNPT